MAMLLTYKNNTTLIYIMSSVSILGGYLLFSTTLIVAGIIGFIVIQELIKSEKFLKNSQDSNAIESQINNLFTGYILCVDLSISSKVPKKVQKLRGLFDDYSCKLIVIEGQMIMDNNFELLKKLEINFFPSLIYIVEGKTVSNDFKVNLSDPQYKDYIEDFIKQNKKKKG